MLGPRMPALAVAFGLLAAIPTEPPAAQQPAGVRGTVEIGVPVPARRRTSAYPSRPVAPPVLAPVAEVRNVVVYLRNAPRQPTAPVRTEIRQRNETFIPRVVAVPVGSTVDFPNDDPFYHNVFSLSRVRTFNLGRYAPGHSRSERFTRPGIVKVFCDIHSHMSATVIVFDHPWFALPDEQGRFELAGVPPGDREITAWHERLGDTTARVRVESGDTASVEFVLPVPEQ